MADKEKAERKRDISKVRREAALTSIPTKKQPRIYLEETEYVERGRYGRG